MTTMKTTALNQSQRREVALVLTYLPHLGRDYAARALSALVRSAPRKSQQRELLKLAIDRGLAQNPEFVINI